MFLDVDARKFDPRLRPPVEHIELEIDPETGMKNYIANENLGIANSAGYVKFSFTRSIHFGRVYTHGASGTKGKEADLYEALRCLGQGLHCLEDFGAHTSYTELALREMGYRDVFSHTGVSTEIDLRGHRVFPLVTGTFGVVDFLHSVLGEATDHFAQSEVEQMDIALKDAKEQNKAAGRASGGSELSNMTGLLSQVPGAGGLAQEARDLQAQSNSQEQVVIHELEGEPSGPHTRLGGLPGDAGAPSANIPGTNLDPAKIASQIYPILVFRDKVVKLVALTIEKIPGLEALVEKITDTINLFILSLLAPFIHPIINAVSAQLKNGSSGVIGASGKHQYEPWTDPHCTDPTHSLLSKDHFSNILNEPAGQVASAILQYVAPRVIYAWQNPDVPVEQVLNDVCQVFHHPALRNPRCELHQNMYSTVERWTQSRADGGRGLNTLLSSDSVRHGRNLTVDDSQTSHSHGGLPIFGKLFGKGDQSKSSGAPWEGLGSFREAPDVGPDGRDRDAVTNEIKGEFPGTQTGFDNTRPPPGPSVGYAAQSDYQTAQHNPYSRQPHPPDNPQEPPAYGQAQQWSQGYASSDGPPVPPKPTEHGSMKGQPTDLYDLPSSHLYGYDGPPPSHEHNYGEEPPPGQYWGSR